MNNVFNQIFLPDLKNKIFRIECENCKLRFLNSNIKIPFIKKEKNESRYVLYGHLSSVHDILISPSSSF